MKILLCSFLFFCSSLSWGAISLQIGQDIRYQIASNGYSIHAVYPWTVKAGYLLGRWSFLAQYSGYTDQREGVANFYMQSSQSSALLWVRRGLWNDWGLFAGAGFGAYQNSVKTALADDSRRDYGRWKPQGAGEIGWWMPIVAHLTIEAVAQVAVAQELQPTLVWGIGGRLGVVF